MMTMTDDVRLQRLANVLVNYSTAVQPGEWVGILGDVAALPALREVFAAVVKAGGHPVLMLSDEAMTRHFLREASDDQLNWLDPALTTYYEQADVYIRIGSSTNTRAMTRIPAARGADAALGPAPVVGYAPDTLRRW
ncbi:aminopeptidase [bacterium]|nr:aminopeptidase [bacterium]